MTKLSSHCNWLLTRARNGPGMGMEWMGHRVLYALLFELVEIISENLRPLRGRLALRPSNRGWGNIKRNSNLFTFFERYWINWNEIWKNLIALVSNWYALIDLWIHPLPLCELYKLHKLHVDYHRLSSCSPHEVHCSRHGVTWGRGWMTKASGVGERRKGRGELRKDCHHRVAALFVPTRMQQWYIDIWYITMIYMGEGAGGGPFAGKITWCPWGAPEYVLKQEDSSELTLAFVIMTIIANNDKM